MPKIKISDKSVGEHWPDEKKALRVYINWIRNNHPDLKIELVKGIMNDEDARKTCKIIKQRKIWDDFRKSDEAFRLQGIVR